MFLVCGSVYSQSNEIMGGSKNPIDTIDVPFAVIEDVPVFPGCEGIPNSEMRYCFQQQMNVHIRKHFKYPKKSYRQKVQGRVYINFIIGVDGRITNIKARGPNEDLEQEAIRIIKLLPKMTPGYSNGVAVRVPFSIPITFKL